MAGTRFLVDKNSRDGTQISQLALLYYLRTDRAAGLLQVAKNYRRISQLTKDQREAVKSASPFANVDSTDAIPKQPPASVLPIHKIRLVAICDSR